jgi:YD repeat-containing protein
MNQLIKIKEDETARSNPDVDVWGTVSVDSGATITLLKVNDLNANYSAGYFIKDDLSLTNNATQTVTAVVTDSRGYVTTNTVTLYYDEMADIGYAYDLRGNMIYKSEHGAETLYIYDDRDFLREAHLPNGDKVLIETGAAGRRLKREFYDYSAGTWETAYYVYAGIQSIADYDDDWNLEAYYIPGLGIDRTR